jgi:hypothetical protein
MITVNTVKDAFLHRTAKVEYSNEVQFAGTLKTPNDKEILPGMVMKHLGNNVVDLYDGTGTPFGLASVFYARTFGNGGVNQLGPNNEFTVIVGGNNTTVRISKEAIATDAAFAFPGTGVAVPVNAGADGKLTSKAGARVGNLLELDDDSIVIQLLDPSVIANA